MDAEVPAPWPAPSWLPIVQTLMPGGSNAGSGYSRMDMALDDQDGEHSCLWNRLMHREQTPSIDCPASEGSSCVDEDAGIV